MNVKERAKKFAINAHNGQVRKNEPDKPLIIHSIGVAKILESYGLDDNVVAAGYLHDVVEDTKYEIEYIFEMFGADIAELVNNASEPDKSLSWEERKIYSINITKNLSLRNKLLICADKINNLESLLIKFIKEAKRDFSEFKRGEEKQRWYYTSMYESLILNEDENHPMFKRLKEVIDILFYNKENNYLKDVIFADKLEYYEKLKKLHAQKEELKSLKQITPLKPFVIEFSGTPRTGKTTLINNLVDFFKKGGFNVKVIEEFTTSKYYKEKFKLKANKLSDWENNMAIIEAVKNQLEFSVMTGSYDIILVDRSLNDRQVWNYRKYIKHGINEKVYLSAKEKYKKISKELIDSLIITYCEPLVALRRDYENALALEKRRFLNETNICEYNEALLSLQELFENSVNNYLFLDTTNVSKEDITITVTENIMKTIKNTYLENFKKYINSYLE